MTLHRPHVSRVTALLIALVIAVVAVGSVFAFANPLAHDRAAATAVANGTKVARGVTVVLPAKYDQSKWHLSVTQPADAATGSIQATKLEPLATAWDYHAAPRVPPGTKLVFQTRTGIKTPVFEAYFDPTNDTWVPEPTTYNPATGVATATVAHFSVHDLFTWPLAALKAVYEGAMQNVFGSLAIGAPAPVCGNPNGVRMYYEGGTSSVLACHDTIITSAPSSGNPGSGTITVRLVNNRNYPIDVYYPKGASAYSSDPGSVTSQIGAVVSKAATAIGGRQSILVPPGAKATVDLPATAPPFQKLEVSAQIDGDALLVGILGTAVDELGTMSNVPLETLTRTLVESWGGAQAMYRINSELTATNLSPAQIKKITDVAIDAILTVFADDANAILASAAKVGVALLGELTQTIISMADTATHQAYHHYTFGPYGSTWDQTTDLHSVDWSSVTVPGKWFLGPDNVKLTNGVATGVPTGISYDGKPEVETVQGPAPGQVVYGTIGGMQVAAIPVFVNPVGTASANRADGWVVYTESSGGLRVLGVITPKSGWPNAWSPNPTQADNVSLIFVLTISGNQISANEVYFRANDITAKPSGRALTTWTWNGSALVAGQPQITQ